MAQAEKSAAHPAASTQNGGTNVVTLGPRDSMHGRLDIHGDLKIGGNVEGELKASGDVVVEPTATVQASIEGANVQVRGEVTGSATAPPPAPPRGGPARPTAARRIPHTSGPCPLRCGRSSIRGARTPPHCD